MAPSKTGSPWAGRLNSSVRQHMIFSIVLLSAILAAMLGNILVFVAWRKRNARLSRNLSIASLIAFVIAICFCFDLFTQVWVASPESISGPALLWSGALFLLLSAAAVVSLIARWYKHRHAAA